MNPTEQQYDPDAAGAPSVAAEGLAAISADRSGHLHFKCKRCGKFETEFVTDVRGVLVGLAQRHGGLPQLHTCPDGAIGLTELVGGMVNLDQRNREALERMEKK